jgi:prepilin-type N-terminal cleavage/methylation domain-containing protein
MTKGLGNKGFTLIEILVAMALVAIILVMVTGTTFSTRKNLDEFLSKIERVARFSTDEATLNNKFLRLSFNLEEEENILQLDFSDDLKLLIDIEEEKARYEEDDDDDDENKPKKRDPFRKHPEFDAEEFSVPVGVRVIGVSSNLINRLITDQKASVYFYPTGEKDSAIIILATDDEMAYLEIEPFRQQIKRTYVKYETELTEDNFTDTVEDMATQIYNKWLQKK